MRKWKRLDRDIEIFKVQEPAKEVASKHLAKFGGFYMVILVICFIYASLTLPAEKIAVVAGLITMVVTGLLTILKGITDTEEKDPMVSVVRELIQRLDTTEEEFKVSVDNGKVNIQKGDSQIEVDEPVIDPATEHSEIRKN